jgi:hypothetical protein
LACARTQDAGLGAELLEYDAGYAAAGIMALLSPLFLAVLPVLSPVSLLTTMHDCVDMRVRPPKISQLSACMHASWSSMVVSAQPLCNCARYESFAGNALRLKAICRRGMQLSTCTQILQ